MCEDAGDEIDELEENGGLEMPTGKRVSDVVLLNGKDITTLKTEAIKVELKRRGLKKTGNKCTLVERLRAALISEHVSQGVETESDSQKPHLKEKTVKAQSFIKDQEIYLFIEAKVREVCCKEIKNLKSEASTSYANEPLKLLRAKMTPSNKRLREMVSHCTSMKEEAKKLRDENKSLMTAIMFLKDGAYYCYCAYVLRISRYSDFLSVMLIKTVIPLRGLKLSGKSRS